MKVIYKKILLVTFVTLLSMNFLCEAEEWVNKCSYDDRSYVSILYPMFDIDEFPLRVCIDNNFSKQKKDLIHLAVDIWNDEYAKYKEMRWGSAFVHGIPHWLFVNCDSKDSYNKRNDYIYITEKSLNYDNVQKNQLGSAQHKNDGVLFNNLDYIEINIATDAPLDLGIQRTSYTSLFINVVLHELGHALTIPHIKYGRLMFFNMKFCKQEAGICKPRSKTFDVFLIRYNPDKAYKMVFPEYNNPCGGPMGTNGRCL